METLKVGTKSNPNSVAGALANVIREKGIVEIQSIGAGALNQAIKAIAIARGFVAPSGKNLVCIPAFTDIQVSGEERTENECLGCKRNNPNLHNGIYAKVMNWKTNRKIKFITVVNRSGKDGR